MMDDDAYIAGVEVGIDMGRREVLEWMRRESIAPEDGNYRPISPLTWQAKLKEWGLSPSGIEE